MPMNEDNKKKAGPKRTFSPRRFGPNAPDKSQEEIKEGLEEVKQKLEETTKKSHWSIRFLKTLIQRKFDFIYGGLGGATVGIVLTATGIYDALIEDFVVENSHGPCIEGGRGNSAYNEVANRLSGELRDAGFPGYGFCNSSAGAASNNNRLSPAFEGNEQNFSIAQADSDRNQEDRGEIGHITQIFNLPNNPECLFMPVEPLFAENRAIQNFSDLQRFSAEQAALKAQGQPYMILRVALIKEGSGSYESGLNVVNMGLDPEVVEVRTYFDAMEVVDAVQDGAADFGVFTEYPGRTQGAFQHGVRAIFNSGVQTIPMTIDAYQQSFQASDRGYRLLEVTSDREFSKNPLRWPGNLTESSVAFAPMMCTNMTINGRALESISDAGVRDEYIQHLQDTVQNRISPEDLTISHNTTYRVIAEPIGPG